MRFGYRLSRLLGSVHCNANVLFVPPDGTSVLTAVGNRVLWVDLVNHATSAMPFEARKDIELLAASHDGRILVVVDVEGRALLINLQRRVVLHRLNLKSRVRAVAFSPDDRYMAFAVGRTVEVWCTPGRRHQFAPLVLYKTYGGSTDDVTCISWAPDGCNLLVGGKDMTARLHYNNDSGVPTGFVSSTLAGHRDVLRGVFFDPSGRQCFTVSRDGGVFTWEFDADAELTAGAARPDLTLYSPTHGRWRLANKNFLRQSTGMRCLVESVAMAQEKGLLVVGFNLGVFGLYEMPGGAAIHTLSVGKGTGITTAAIARGGEWLAFGSGRTGQLLVWEWQSETYVLKQAGHSYGLNALAFSPNGALCATGGEDGKVKLWSVTSGFCFATFAEHEAPITAVVFVPGGGAILSASLDGTVRAHDLTRYRCFRTLATPAAAQLTSLAVDPAGEVVVAGAADPFELYVWSLQTGKVLDVFGGHEAPIADVAFSPTEPIVASASWDGTVKLWNIYKSELVETLEMPADVLAVAFRPDGKQVCCACLNGTLQLWGVEDGDLQKVIEGQRDVAGGRHSGDKITAKANARSKHFTSVAYSVDGSCVLAGGESRHVCLYACASGILVRKFQVSHNRSLEGILDELHSGRLTEGGSLDLLPASDSEGEGRGSGGGLPGAKRGNEGKRQPAHILTACLNARPRCCFRCRAQTKEAVRTTCVRFSPTGQEWAAATPHGVLLFALDDVTAFTPTDLDEDATPAAARAAIARRDWARAILMALTLGEAPLLAEAVDAVPPDEVPLVAQAIPAGLASRLLAALARRLEAARALEYHLCWVRALLRAHGPRLRAEAGRDVGARGALRAVHKVCEAGRDAGARGALRAVHKAITNHERDLFKLARQNQYTLQFVAMEPPAAAAAATMMAEAAEPAKLQQHADVDAMIVSEAAVQADDGAMEVNAVLYTGKHKRR
ncbi:periodic tryptophan protein 2 [Tribonema minus]|uniref:Periodic tryptophan protein 2 n=1 Tax=Tribonema minus TaxID=303371 RepID=A0A836CGV6_9STRA|nr:periodic tryptophan protein 2 [Tribonema minus]